MIIYLKREYLFFQKNLMKLEIQKLKLIFIEVQNFFLIIILEIIEEDQLK